MGKSVTISSDGLDDASKGAAFHLYFSGKIGQSIDQRLRYEVGGPAQTSDGKPLRTRAKAGLLSVLDALTDGQRAAGDTFLAACFSRWTAAQPQGPEFVVDEFNAAARTVDFTIYLSGKPGDRVRDRLEIEMKGEVTTVGGNVVQAEPVAEKLSELGLTQDMEDAGFSFLQALHQVWRTSIPANGEIQTEDLTDGSRGMHLGIDFTGKPTDPIRDRFRIQVSGTAQLADGTEVGAGVFAQLVKDLDFLTGAEKLEYFRISRKIYRHTWRQHSNDAPAS